MKIITVNVLSIAILLAGCAVPYAEKGTQGFKGGYQDKRLGESHFAIEVEGNGFTDYVTLEDYFKRRAAELCEGREYERSWERTTTQHSNYYFSGGAGVSNHTFPVLVGEVKCK